MRVAIDTSYAARGESGTAVYIERLIAALEDEGVEVVRLRQPLRRRRGGRNKVRSAANAAFDLAWTRELLPRAAERAKADVLHHPLPAWSPTKIPQVVTVHDVAFAQHPEDFDPLWRRIALRSHRSAVKHADAVVAVSETTKRDAVGWLRAPAERVVVASHGAGQELALMQDRTREHFLYVGDDEPRKNVAGLLEAHARYRRMGGAKALVVAGAAAARGDAAGHADAAGTQAAASTEAADVPVIGVPDPDAAALADLHARAIALVHPSRDEGFGLTVLEAMSVGTPVIAARNAAIEEIAADAALIVDDWALAEAMQRVERDERLQRMMGIAGRQRAAAFSWQRSAQAHIEAYTLARDSR
jgi:glycosyltransferase involved in cell wall biosynthesis